VPVSKWVDSGSGKISFRTYTTSSGSERWALSSSPDIINVDSSTKISETGYFHQHSVTFSYTVSDGSPSDPAAYYKQFNADKIVIAKQTTPGSDWVDATSAVMYDNPIADAKGFKWAIPEGATPKTTVISSVNSATLINPVYVLQSPVGLVFPPGFDPGTITIKSSDVAGELGLYSLGDAIGPYFDVEILNNDLTGTVTIAIHYYSPSDLTLEQEQNLHLYMSDPVDLNGDGTVNGNDVDIIQSAIHDHLSAVDYPQFDVNSDGKINSADLDIVKDFANSGLLVPSSSGGQWRLPWLDITTSIDIENNIIYGVTDHFSGFGIRQF
ncbi:MAG TPA: dockerin type I domain-containing protein, partial [Saprospiraceae bacterium]|nr:dockerin type I domain-containing protein [Saprospiraceae bacterium]